MDTIQAIWDRIEAWIATHTPDVLDNLLPGVDEDDIQEVEAELGYRLPEDVRASLRIHNGTVDCFADMWGLLNLDDILRQQQVQLEVLHSLQENAGNEPGNAIWWWYPHWIPLAFDGAGDLLCTDVAPPSNEPFGQIIHFDHEIGSHWIASGFQALLSAFADHLETGKYTPGEFGNLESEHFLFDQPQIPPGERPKYY